MRRRQKKKINLFLVLIIIVIIFSIIFLILGIEKNIGETAVRQGEHYSKLEANKIINRVVSDYLKENEYKYSDFSAVLYDENGRAVSIESLTYNINKVQSELSLKISENFSESRNIRAKIPLGSLTDSYLLAGKGPSIPLNICSAGNVEVKLKSEFISAGINQTCHRISAVINTDINSSIPLYSFSSSGEFEFLLAENIIVGEVPDYKTGMF